MAVPRPIDSQRPAECRPRRVLVAANTPPAAGGVGGAAGAVVTELSHRGLDVDTMWRTPRRLRLPGAIDNLLFSAAVGWRARRRRYDVVHAHTSAGCLVHLLARRDTARLMTSQGDERALWRLELDRWRRGVHRLRPWSHLLVPALRLPQFEAALRHADVVFALHEEEAASYRSRRHAPAETVVLVPNGCHLPPKEGAPERGRLTFIGTWIWRKGTPQLVSAFGAARRRDPTLTLTLVGPDESAVADFAPEDRPFVRGLGHCGPDEIASALSSTDMLVLPSLFEGMPLVALEAMAWGVPVVGSDLPGMRAAVADAGVLSAVDDVEALASGIVDLVADRERRRRLGAEARRRATALTWAATSAKVVKAYDQAYGIAAARARPAPAKHRAVEVEAGSGG